MFCFPTIHSYTLVRCNLFWGRRVCNILNKRSETSRSNWKNGVENFITYESRENKNGFAEFRKGQNVYFWFITFINKCVFFGNFFYGVATTQRRTENSEYIYIYIYRMPSIHRMYCTWLSECQCSTNNTRYERCRQTNV